MARTARRPGSVRAQECERATVLYPLIAAAARHAGARSVGLIDVGTITGFNLVADRAGVSYSNGTRLGQAASPLQVTARVVGPGPIPADLIPQVVSRAGVGRNPLNLADPADATWLRTHHGLQEAQRVERLEAAITLVGALRPELERGDPVALLPHAASRVPTGALPVVMTTWALSALAPARRAAFLRQLTQVAQERAVAWVSAEGVGVAPAVPTLGDRRASGHSILGLVLLGGPGGAGRACQAVALGRCWMRGQMLSWIADQA